MRKLVLTATAATLAFGGAAYAQSMEARPYVGAGAGYLFSDSDVELGAAVGRAGVDLGDYLGVEAEGALGVDGDTVGTSEIELDHLLAGYGRLRAPVAPNLELFARAGYYTAEADVSGPLVTGSFDDDDIALGVGAELMLAGQHGIRADYTNYGVDDDGHSGALSYVFHF